MKKVIYITLLVTCVISLSSCRGSGGKKVATEAFEFIEKEAGSLERNAGRLERGAMVVEENANKASKSAEEEYNSYNSYQKYRKAKKWQDRIENCFDEDENVETTPQPVTIPCPHCQGNGMVYATDMYGNLIYDYYGNPQVVYCPQCGGNRVVVTYQ